MKPSTYTKAVAVLTGALCLSSALFADMLETKSGAKLTGKVASIDGTTIVLKTDYAGDIKVKQSEVVGITTDEAVYVRLKGGTVVQGKVTSSGIGAVTVTGAEATMSSTVENVVATWAPGAIDPDVAALQRRWVYEAAIDVAGKSGNREQLGTSFSARAALKTPQDALEFYTAYDRQVSDGTKSADQFKAGVDYSNNFAGRTSWYVRDEGGFDRVKGIELYNIAAAGFGYDFIKKAKQTLTGRAGVSFRYEGYKSPLIEDVKAAGLDIGVNHTYTGSYWAMVNRVSWVPLFEDFANYRLQHESFFELPLASPQWKMRLGVANDYNSEPAPGVEKLDTTYFARLVLSFK